jgi:hypothetical protein
MDRRQLLFGGTALGLVTNLNLNHPFIGHFGEATMGSGRFSDRERAGLHGPVKTRSDLMGDDTESMSETEYAADGRLLVWRGRTFVGSVGSRVKEWVCSYDRMGRLISITSGGADVTDEFHYDEQGKKTRVRTVPPKPGHERVTMSVEGMFEVTEEGYCLNGGGSVTTRYNDDDQPIESLVRDADGELLVQIVHNYADGRLVSETLIQEAFELPGQLRERFSEEQRRAFRAQSKKALSQLGLNGMERSYGYDDWGRVIRRLMRMGNFHQDTSTTYNEHGDEAGTVRIQSGSLDPRQPHLDNERSERSEIRYLYQYDSHGNWTERTTTRSHGSGDPNTHRRTLAYY